MENKVMNKNLLVIAFKFPPMGGVGTRRWAKFSKYLTMLGYTVHVLTIDYKRLDTINWVKDIEYNKNILVYRIKSGCPSIFLKEDKTLFEKVVSKIVYILLKNLFFYIDIAQNWAKHMLPYASKIIKKYNIVNVIVTSPPHSVAYYASYLKSSFPNINLIQDFRDNWNDDEYYEYKKRIKYFWQREKSLYMEDFTVRHSDFIVNTTKDMTNNLSHRYPNYSCKFKTIYNGFDKDDVKVLENNKKKNMFTNNRIKILYAGSLDNGRLEALYLILNAVSKMSLKLEINIYSSFNCSKIKPEYKKFIGKIVFFNKPTSHSEIIKIIQKHDYCLSINSPAYPYAFGAKIFDYMLLNKEIIHISNYGELYELMLMTGQHVSDYNTSNVEKMLLDISTKATDSSEIDYSCFDIKNLTVQFTLLFLFK